MVKIAPKPKTVQTIRVPIDLLKPIERGRFFVAVVDLLTAMVGHREEYAMLIAQEHGLTVFLGDQEYDVRNAPYKEETLSAK